MGLLRGVARTAAVAGTATVVSNRVSRRQGRRWAKQDAEQEQADSPTDVAPDDTDAQIAQLEKLGELHDKGILTDEEFAAKKQRIIGM